MGARYDLIGAYWDRQKIETTHKTRTIDFNVLYTDDTKYLSLFDIDKVKKRIKASEFLNLKHDRDFYKILNRFKNCHLLGLVLDDEKSLASPIVEEFYFKRLNDVAVKLEKSNPSLEVVFMREKNHEDN